MTAIFPNLLIIVVGLACFCQDVLGDRNLSEEYQSSTALAGDDYMLYWTVNHQSQGIRFAVSVSTTGWVGFGLSPNGQMPGSDVVIGWIDGNGNAKFHDMYAETRSLPAIDESQDWFLTYGQEENGRTILEFHRFLMTCDDNDMEIMAETARIVWSYNSQDPSSLEELGELQHDRRGSASLNLLAGFVEEREEGNNTSSFRVINENVTIPADKETTYWCSVHELPQEIEENESYMYKISPVIYKPTENYVHHFLAYLCTNLNGSQNGSSDECSSENNIDIGICLQTGVLFAGWATGGMDFLFPEGVAFPFGGRGPQYVVLQIHYDNPNLDSGVVDNSGLEIFYDYEEPENRALVLTLGQHVSSTMVIPPKADNFVVNALCPGQCTKKFYPEEGINVFGNLLHTHLAGNGLVVRHFRETSSCGGLEELQPIDENRRYDFNFQQGVVLPRTVQVLPGDILQLECSYRTTDSAYQDVVLGGESTREEMCFSFLYYYPETDLTYCLGYQLVSQDFTSQHFDSNTERALFSSFQADNHTEVIDIFKQVDWNSETIDSFQNSVNSNTFSTSCINSTDIYSSVNIAAQLPEVDCPYEPINNCPNSSGTTSVHHYTYFVLYCLTFFHYMI